MGNMSAPDRIWTTGNDTSGAWNGTSACTKRITLDETQFLASTPAREHAEELVDVLKELMDLMEGVIEGDYKPDSFTNQPGRMLLSKIDTGETDATNQRNSS